MLGKKRGLQTTPPTHTHTLHPGRNQQRKQRRGKSEKRACCWKTNPKKNMQPGGGSEGLTSRKWGTRTGFNNKEVLGLQKSSFRRAGKATQPNRQGSRKWEARSFASKRSKHLKIKLVEEVGPREILFY